MTQLPLAIPVLLTIAGAALAVAMLALDGLVGQRAIPELLRQLGPANVRNLLTTLAGALLSVLVLVFWIRMVAVSMASRMFSASMLQDFLQDRFQQVTMGLVIGVLVYVILVSQAVPDGDAGMSQMPHLSVAVGLLLVAIVAVLVVGTVAEGARVSRTGSLLRRVADDVVAQVRTTHPERGAVHDTGADELTPSQPPAGPAHVVLADASGWVQRLEEDRVLASLPNGAVAQLQLRVGQFLTEGTPLCRIWHADGDGDHPPTPGEDLSATVDTEVRSALVLGDGPTLEQDVAFGLRMLSDVAERALAPAATGDTSAAEQAIVRIGAVLRELLLRDLPTPTRQDQRGRVLLRPFELGPADYVSRGFDRVRQAGVTSPVVAMALLNTLGMLRDAMEEAGRHGYVPPLRRQAAMIVDGAQRSNIVAADFQEVRDLAERHGLLEPDGSEPTPEPTRAPTR